MVQGKWFPMGSDIALPLSIRQGVFSRGRDDGDDQAWQVVVFDGDTPVGAARLWWADGAFWLGDVGVLQDHRGRGFGDLLVRLLLFKSLTHGASLICLTPTEDTQAFFARYGFLETPQGYMAIRGADVALDGCAGCKGCH